MGVLDEETVNRIKQHIKWHPRGLTISDLASRLQMNRNLVAKYLDMLLISGQVEMQVIGAAKVYFFSKRTPMSALLEFSSDFVIMVDHDFRILHVNELVPALLDEKKESLIGRMIHEIKSPFMENLSGIGLFKKSPESGELVTETACSIRGEERHFRIKQIPTAFENGSAGFTFIIEEITARKKYQQMLEISEARYRGLVQSSGEAIVGMNADREISSWNPAAKQLFGYDEDEVMTKPARMLIPEGPLQEFDEILKRVMLGGGIQRLEMKMACKNMAIIDTICTISPMRGEDGAISGASSIIRDITRDKIERHLRDYENQYRTLFEDLSVGIYRSTGDPDGRFVWGNTALLHILGYQNLSDLEEIHVTDIFSKPDGRMELLADLKTRRFVKNRIINLRRNDGTPITVSVTALAEFDERENLVYINGIVQDVTGFTPKGSLAPQ